MTLVGLVRVNTKGQDTARQHGTLDPICVKVFDEKVSGKLAIADVLTQYRVTEVLGAWGGLKHATVRRAKLDVLDALDRLGARLFMFDGLTSGEPRHPTPRGTPLLMRGEKLYLRRVDNRFVEEPLAKSTVESASLSS